MVFTSCYAVFFTIIFRKNEIVEKAAYMTIIFLLSIPFYAFAHWALPVNLGFLPTFLSGSDGWPDLIFGLLIYVAGYFGGVLQLYNLADRGLSLRMLIDMAEASKNGMTAKDLFAGYSNGKVRRRHPFRSQGGRADPSGVRAPRPAFVAR